VTEECLRILYWTQPYREIGPRDRRHDDTSGGAAAGITLLLPCPSTTRHAAKNSPPAASRCGRQGEARRSSDWEHADIPGETVTAMVVRGLIERDAGGRLDLTERGRAVLPAMLPKL